MSERLVARGVLDVELEGRPSDPAGPDDAAPDDAGMESMRGELQVTGPAAG